MEFPEFPFATSRGLPAKQNSGKQFYLVTFFNHLATKNASGDKKMLNLYLNLFSSNGVKTIIKTWLHSRNSGKRDRKQHTPVGILIICNPRISMLISVLLDQGDLSVPQYLWTSLTAASSTTARSWKGSRESLHFPKLPPVKTIPHLWKQLWTALNRWSK